MSRYYVLALLAYLGTTAAVDLSCANNEDTRYCIGTQIQHQCTVLGGDVTLRWRVLDDQGTLLGQRVYSTGGPPDNPETIFNAANFTTVITANGNPFMSNISFAASLSQNGYMILCAEVGVQSENCSIIIADPPSRISDLMISQFTSTSVQLSWTDNSPCINNYIISSTTSNDPITTGGTSYELGSLSLGDTAIHTVSVAGNDTGGRTGPSSNTVCFIFNVPAMVSSLTHSLDNGTNDTAIINVAWEGTEEPCHLPVSYYYITHNATDDGITQLSSTTTNYVIDDVSKGIYVMVTVFAENVLGNGTERSIIFAIPDVIPPPEPVPTSTAGPSPSDSSKPKASSGFPLGATVAIVVVAVVVLVVVLVVAMAIYIVCKKKRNSRTSAKDDSQLNYADLEMSNKKASSSKKKASKNSQQTPPQDTSAVLYSDVSHDSKPKNTEQMFYADLALDSNTPEPKHKPRNVQYADIRQQSS